MKKKLILWEFTEKFDFLGGGSMNFFFFVGGGGGGESPKKEGLG